MQGNPKKIDEILYGSKMLIIPVYQRNYNWTRENCGQLFSDLMELHNSGKHSHFFGSIVSSYTTNGERIIIDGQQRITTVSLLLMALINGCKEGVIEAGDTSLPGMIFHRYLTEEFNGEDKRKVKLKPIKQEIDAYDALLYNKKESIVETSNMTKNYNYFYKKIADSGLKLDEILKAVCRLEVIDITLGGDDDPQRIFESLNSTGLDLSEADKIRNYLLMSLGEKEQVEMYEGYWRPIEEKTNREPSPFVRDYLTMKRGRVANEKRIYFEFKDYCQKSGGGKMAVLKDMRHYAEIYHSIVNASTGNTRLDQKLREMDIMRSTVAYPYYMAFFNYADEKGFTADGKREVIDLMENYLIRRVICKMPSNALNKVFATLHGDVLRIMGESKDERYTAALKYCLRDKSGSASFPSDSQIWEEFPRRDVYNMDKRQRLFLFERLENRNNRERHDVVGMLTDKERKVSIEHIMPQTLSPIWKRELGSEWERVHGQYLNTMANLTLTGYNAAYSNMPFIKKRDCENGFSGSAFRLNNYVKTCQKWTEDELKERKNELLGVFLHLWPMPTTDFVLADRQSDSVSLDDDGFEFTGKKLVAYTYQGARQLVKNWREMLVGVCTIFAQEHKATVERLCASKSYYFTNEKRGRRPEEIGPNLYVETNSSTDAKLTTLRHLFDVCNIPQSELAFEFSQKADGGNGRRGSSRGQGA